MKNLEFRGDGGLYKRTDAKTLDNGFNPGEWNEEEHPRDEKGRFAGGVAEPDHVQSLVSKHVTDLDAMTSEEKTQLAHAIHTSTLKDVGTLYRVSRDDPGWKPGSVITFGEPKSSTTVDVSTGKSAGQITFKSRDKAVIVIDNPKHGIAVDYSKVSQHHFYAGDEKEVIIAGKYMVVSVEQIPEPGTNPAYGYKVPKYTLREVE